MGRHLRLLAAGAVLALVSASGLTGCGPTVPGTSCPMFPADSHWHADVRSLPVLASSSSIVSTVGSTAALKADFGSGTWDGGPIGIPYVVVPAGQPKVRVTFDYADESDPGPYPVPANPPIEGGPNAAGDRHILIVDKGACTLYELYDAHPTGTSAWTAGSGAIWDLRSNALRPAGWTSADAAGLPILPGLLRWSEVRAGSVDHAIRFTAPTTAPRYLWPARHQAGSDPSAPPMGARFRLVSGFDTSGYSTRTRTVLRAMQTYGLVLADNGSPWYFQGERNAKWPARMIEELKTVPSSAFEAVDTAGMMVEDRSARVR